MTLDFFIRKTEVEIEDIGIFRSGKFDGVQNDLDIYFEIGSNRDDESYDEVTLYNINDANRSKLSEAEDNLIRVSSGYETNYGKIGWGKVKKVENHLEKTGDVKTVIQVKSINEILNETTMAKVYKQNTPVKEFFNDISALTGYPLGEIRSAFVFKDDFIIDRTRTIASWIHEVERMTKDTDEECHYIKKFGMLNFIPKGYGLKQTAAIDINSTTGLLNLVEHKEDGLSGWNVECFLIPGIFNELEVHLEAKFPREVDGVFVVREYKYTSNKETHKVQFVVEKAKDA